MAGFDYTDLYGQNGGGYGANPSQGVGGAKPLWSSATEDPLTRAAKLRATGIPTPTPAPIAAPVVAPAPPPVNTPPWFKSVNAFKTASAPVAGGLMTGLGVAGVAAGGAYGMATQPIDESSPVHPAIQRVQGLDSMGIGTNFNDKMGNVGDWMSGNVPAPSSVLRFMADPANLIGKMAGAPGATDIAKPWVMPAARVQGAPKPPLLDDAGNVLPAAGTGTDASPAVVQANASSFAQHSVLPAVDKLIGPGGTYANGGNPDAVNSRIRGFGANPEALTGLNRAQELNRTGITATRQENGNISFSGDPAAEKKIYTGADGKPTTKWTDTEEYQSAIARNAADKAALSKIESKKEQEGALALAARPATTARLGANATIAHALLTNQIQRETNAATNAATNAETARKTTADQHKAAVDYMNAVSNGDLKAQEAAQKQFQVAMAGGVLASGGGFGAAAAAAGGRAGPHTTFGESVTSMPDPKTGALKIINHGTGEVKTVTPTPSLVTEGNITASMKARNLTRAQVIEQYKAAGHDISGLK